MSDVEEDEGEGGEDFVTKNPIGEYHGHRNNKNERHGRGRAVLPNGDLYLGCYYRGQRHGLGIYRYKKGNGARYGGDWKFGQKDGWGTFYYPDASQYTGNWSNGVKHGWGVYVYPNGDEYEGWWYLGERNGRGIYRTKKTGEKFVGDWILGKRQGPGMLIRKYHRYIGYWYNDVPRGEGVYVFPDLGAEQHGKYTHFKALPESVERLIASGKQVRHIRAAPPPIDPMGVEKERFDFFLRAIDEEGGEDDFGGGGEGYPPGYYALLKAKELARVAEGKSRTATTAPNTETTDEDMEAENPPVIPDTPGIMMNPAQRAEYLIQIYMKDWIENQKKDDDEKVPVVPMWRVTHVTGLITPIPDETVPPPPMPPTPQPPIELEPETPDTAGMQTTDEDPVTQARRLAMTHELILPPYAGSGVCQPDSVPIKLPPEIEPYNRFSELDFENLDDFRAGIEATGGQLGPYDIEEAIRANEEYMKSQGIEVAKRWRGTLGADGKCQPIPDRVPGIPGDEVVESVASTPAPTAVPSMAPSNAQSMAPSTAPSTAEGFPMISEDEETAEENFTTEDEDY